MGLTWFCVSFVTYSSQSSESNVRSWASELSESIFRSQSGGRPENKHKNVKRVEVDMMQCLWNFSGRKKLVFILNVYAYEFANFKFNPNSLVFVKGYFFFKALLSQQNKYAFNNLLDLSLGRSRKSSCSWSLCCWRMVLAEHRLLKVFSWGRTKWLVFIKYDLSTS